MSRYYEVEVDVSPCPNDHSMRVIVKELEAWGLEVGGQARDCERNIAHYWGNMSLGGGYTEEDEHKDLKEMLPEKILSTRWLCRDNLEWDCEINDSDEEE